MVSLSAGLLPAVLCDKPQLVGFDRGVKNKSVKGRLLSFSQSLEKLWALFGNPFTRVTLKSAAHKCDFTALI